MINWVIAASLSSLFLNLFGVNWESVEKKIAVQFPDVRHVSTDEVLNFYEGGELRDPDQGNITPIIIDVRESDEFAVSHLDGARNWTTVATVTAEITDRSSPIIVYCSVGYRSAQMAEKLQQLGFSNVQNLKGSIFEWANKGYPMMSEFGNTDKVHPFNKAWGVLLEESLHQYP